MVQNKSSPNGRFRGLIKELNKVDSLQMVISKKNVGLHWRNYFVNLNI
jgi:hypothetical protein